MYEEERCYGGGSRGRLEEPPPGGCSSLRLEGGEAAVTLATPQEE